MVVWLRRTRNSLPNRPLEEARYGLDKLLILRKLCGLTFFRDGDKDIGKGGHGFVPVVKTGMCDPTVCLENETDTAPQEREQGDGKVRFHVEWQSTPFGRQWCRSHGAVSPEECSEGKGKGEVTHAIS